MPSTLTGSSPKSEKRGIIGEVRVAFDQIAQLDKQVQELRGHLIGYQPISAPERDFDEVAGSNGILNDVESAARFCQERLLSISETLREIERALS